MNFVVIFKARIKNIDDEYVILASQMRHKAMHDYNCTKFESYQEKDNEVSLSYWSRLEDIQAWHQDTQHLYAQQKSRLSWYDTYSIEVCQIQRAYQSE